MADRAPRWPLSLETLARLSTRAKARTAAGIVAAYAVAHVLVLHPAIGDASGIVAIAPVLGFAMLFGSRGGTLAGLLALPFLMLTRVFLADGGWVEWLWPAGLLGSGGLVVMGALGGRYRDLVLNAAAEPKREPLLAARAARRPRGVTNGAVAASASRRAELAQLVDPLSEREQDVLRLVAEGLPNQEIAEALGVTLHTVKTHVGVILRKLDVTNRTGAVSIAREFEILD